MTKNRLERIRSILAENLHPAHLEVHDNSQAHAGHTGAREGGETHYELVVVAECFQGMSKVQRHQMIYKLLAEEFKTGLHALAIDAQPPG